MITNRELQIIDKSYFMIIQAGGFTISLQSKNTGHYWFLVVEEFPTFRHFKVSHKHNYTDAFHRHKDAPNLKVAIERILVHDEFQMRGRKNYK